MLTINEKQEKIQRDISFVQSKYTILDKEEFDVEGYLKGILKAANDISFHVGIFQCYCLLGAHYIALNSEREAYEKLEQARGIVDEGKVEAYYYSALANVYIMYFSELIGDVDTAIDYYKWGISYVEHNPNKFDEMNLRGNYAELCMLNGAYEEGIKILEEGNKFMRENGYDMFLMFHYVNIGNAYIGLRDYERAMKHLNMAYDLAQSQNNHQVLITSSIGKAKVMIAKDQSDEAITYLMKVVNSIKVNQSGVEDIELAILLARLLCGKGDYQKAYPVLSKFGIKMSKCLNDHIRMPYYELLAKIKLEQSSVEEADIYTKMAQASEEAINLRKKMVFPTDDIR